jgi:hypothetical protein
MGNILKLLFGKKPPPEPMHDITRLAAHLQQSAIHVVAEDAPSRSHFGGEPSACLTEPSNCQRTTPRASDARSALRTP